jgi:hypothetical protein
MRDITLEDTIYIKFTTRAFATGIPTVLAGSPVLSVYEENNLTQITSGVSVSVDYDSVVGLNQATIIATAANGYENGKSYDLVITTGTVGGVSVVGEVVGSFTVGFVSSVADTALTDYGANTVVPDVAGTAPTAAEIDTELTGTHGAGAWTTGGGGSITDILNVKPVIPNSIDLANTATVRIGLMITNAIDDLPSTAEITPGTIDIDRKAIGGTSWSNIISGGACSEQAGMIYFDEVFDSGTGYIEGDSIRITFKSQKITVAANDYEITDANGVMFQTSIRQTMRGTDSANTVEPDPAGTAPTAIENRQEMDSNSTSLAAILADTGELQADDIPTLIAALNDLSSSDILTTALTESYAADGNTATLSQLLYMIWSRLNSLKFVSTTGTSRKLNGADPAMIFTIDDANNPTDIDRTG